MAIDAVVVLAAAGLTMLLPRRSRRPGGRRSPEEAGPPGQLPAAQ